MPRTARVQARAAGGPSAGGLLREATARLLEAGIDTARLDAECLLMHAWNKPRAFLFAHMDEPVPHEVRARFEAMLARRCRREPLAYITGEREFWSLRFEVSPAVLIPRPETEHLVEAALRLAGTAQTAWRVLDLGTGSGCIAVALATELPRAQIVATDISPEALDVARRNAERHRVSERIAFREGSLYAALAEDDGPFDLIVSNPPYVAEHELAELAPELAFEPRIALTDGADGRTVLRAILAGAAEHLKPGGHVILESGPAGFPAAPDALVHLGDVYDLAGALRARIWQKADR